MNIVTLESPSEFLLGDQKFGKASERGLVGNVKDGLLLDATVSGSNSNRGQSELTQEEFLSQILGRDPVYAHRLLKEEVSGENSDLVSLTFKGERKSRIGRVGDVRSRNDHDGSTERVHGNSAQHGEQRNNNRHLNMITGLSVSSYS